MQLGMIGLGRMGANMVRRLLAAGHECVAYDVDPAAIATSAADGAQGAATIEAFVAALRPPRAIWIMVPAAFVDATIEALTPHLSAGDVLVDGGNSMWRDDVDRADRLAPHGIHYLDVGTSGGVYGRERGYCLMVGGNPEAVDLLAPVLDSLAPGVDVAPRTTGREGPPRREELGWLHCGPSGAGHFVKMVHNGIEYGMMAAYAEGLNVLKEAGVGRADHPVDAETAPLRDPRYFTYDLDIAAITEVWRRGSVVASWLLDLTAAALWDDPHLEGFAGRVSDSGEGRWTVQAAVEQGVPTPVLAAALFQRFESRGHGEYAGKVLSAMRKQFGGHAEKAAHETGAGR